MVLSLLTIDAVKGEKTTKKQTRFVHNDKEVDEEQKTEQRNLDTRFSCAR